MSRSAQLVYHLGRLVYQSFDVKFVYIPHERREPSFVNFTKVPDGPDIINLNSCDILNPMWVHFGVKK